MADKANHDYSNAEEEEEEEEEEEGEEVEGYEEEENVEEEEEEAEGYEEEKYVEEEEESPLMFTSYPDADYTGDQFQDVETNKTESDLPEGITLFPPADRFEGPVDGFEGIELDEEAEIRNNARSDLERRITAHSLTNREYEDGNSGYDDDGNELVVLDPDHRLMERFQKALKEHLEKQMYKVTLELREVSETLKKRTAERQELGVNLFGVQEELARHQMMLEKFHDEFAALKQKRNLTDQEMEEVRKIYDEKTKLANCEKKKSAALQAEVENLSLRLFYIQNAKEDMKADIAVMKRVAEKAETKMIRAEEDKHKQDLYVDRLTERVTKLNEEIAMYEAQLAAQIEETRAAKESLSEALMEIEAINVEKKQLFQQWNSSLIGMKRRDEAHATMMTKLNEHQQKIMTLDTEIDGLKKTIQKEQEENEKLTSILSKIEYDISSVKKQLANSQAHYEELQNEYSMCTRILHETEQALAQATNEKSLSLNKLKYLRKEIERVYLEKNRLEDEIVEKMQEQLTMDKAAQYTEKMSKKIRERTKELETQIATTENDISRYLLEGTHIQSNIDGLKKVVRELNAEMDQKNAIILKSETEMQRRINEIERKQNILDALNKKVEVLLGEAGGEELGPLEIQLKALHKEIDHEQTEITEQQQQWLKEQAELVRLAKERDEQSQSIEALKKQLTILTQKRLRVEGDISRQESEVAEIEHNISNMRTDMTKLNLLLHKEKGTENTLQQDNVLVENMFMGKLKDAEKQSIEMQEQLEGLREEKERLLNSLVEAERQIMLWEKKYQLAKETRAAVDSDVGQSEIHAMKTEIHRMQVRYSQLKKQQERMVQDMEKSIIKREVILTRGEAASKSKTKVETKGSLYRQLTDYRKKIKQTTQETDEFEKQIQVLLQQQQEISNEIVEHQTNVQRLQGSSDTLDGDIERLTEVKQKGMIDTITKQQRLKYYQQLKEGKYTRLCKTEAALENEYKKQSERMNNLVAIVDNLVQEFPHAQPALKKVLLCYGSKV